MGSFSWRPGKRRLSVQRGLCDSWVASILYMCSRGKSTVPNCRLHLFGYISLWLPEAGKVNERDVQRRGCGSTYRHLSSEQPECIIAFHQHVDGDLVSSASQNFGVEMPLQHWIQGLNFSGEDKKAAISSRLRRCMQKHVARRKLNQEKPYPKPASHSGRKTELVDRILDDDDEDELDCLSSFERG